MSADDVRRRHRARAPLRPSPPGAAVRCWSAARLSYPPRGGPIPPQTVAKLWSRRFSKGRPPRSQRRSGGSRATRGNTPAHRCCWASAHPGHGNAPACVRRRGRTRNEGAAFAALGPTWSARYPNSVGARQAGVEDPRDSLPAVQLSGLDLASILRVAATGQRSSGVVNEHDHHCG